MLADSVKLRDFAVQYTAAWCSRDSTRVASFYSPGGSLTVNNDPPAVGRHLQGRGGKIVAIKVSNYVKQEHIRQKTHGNPTAGAAGNVIDDTGWGRQFSFCDDRISRAGSRRPKVTRSYTNFVRAAMGEAVY